MSIASNIMGLFNGSKAAEAPVAPTQQSQQAPQAPVTQTDSQVTQETQAPAEPTLDMFKDLWQAPADDKLPQKFDPANIFTIDHENVNKQVQAMNFTTGITQAQIDRVSAGGEDAIKATLEMINLASQNAFRNSVLAAAELTKGALVTADKLLDTRIQNQAKQYQASSALREANPVLSHPAAEPMIKALEAQLNLKFPNATPAEITKLAQDYLTSFAGEIKGKPASPVEEGEVDWSKFG